MEAESLTGQQSIEFTGNVGIVRALKSPSVAYLKTVLGKILPKALSEICEKRPPDPIEELARWLYQWADCELYYYEKAIFAKELQLMALHLDKETSRRHARTQALKKEKYALRYLTSNERALVSFLSKKNITSKTTFTSKDSRLHMEMQSWARELAGEDISGTTTSVSSEGHITSAAGKRRATVLETEERRKRKRFSGVFDLESTASRPSSSKRRLRKSPLDQDSDINQVSRQRKGARKRKLTDESEDERVDAFADCYGAEAKLRYGFEVTPVRCTWYLAEPNILVCVHPVLGEIRATIPTKTPLANTPEWWEQNEYKFEVMYDHEIYAHPNPHFDDGQYKERMVVWADDEMQEAEYLMQDEENNDEAE